MADHAHYSPPSSPGGRRTPISCSPPTSPIRHSDSSLPAVSCDDSSSDGISVPISATLTRKKRKARTTYQRQIRKRVAEDSGESDDECARVSNQSETTIEQDETLVNKNQHEPLREDITNRIHSFPESDSHNGGHGNGNNPHNGVNRDLQENYPRDVQGRLSSSDSDTDSDTDSDASAGSVQSVGIANYASSVEVNHSSEERDSDGSDSSTDDLYEGSTVSANAGLLKVLKLFVSQGWTKTSLDQNVRMIKDLLPQPNEMPANGKAALTRLEKLTSSYHETEFVYCEKCLELVDTDSDDCSHDEGQGKFYSFPIDEQLKHMFEQRQLASKVDSYRDHASKIPNHICDIVHGSEYHRVKSKLTGPYDLIVLWSSDGVAMSGSSNQEMWLILGTICEVPPRLRSSYVIVAGVYVGSKAPKMNVFLKPFTDSLTNLFEEGFTWVHPTTKENHVSRLAAPALSADAPAKAHILNCKSFSHRYGCVICEQKAKKIQQLADPGGKRYRRFLFEDDIEAAPLRTGPRMDALGKLAEERKKSRKGIVGESVISDIPLLDRATCVAAEYMHMVLLGVVKYLLLIIFTKAGPWYLGDKVDAIDQFITNEIKVPYFINRLPRQLKDIKYWKASELRAFLLYYSLPIFKKFGLCDVFLQHWILLVAAMYILLKPAISEIDLQRAEIMIRDFVRDIGRLYGEKCYTYNVHNLLHLCLLVRRWGPLWATSAFLFESYNGFVGAHIHGTKHLGKELINNIKIFQSVAVLDNIVKIACDENIPSQRKPPKVLGLPWKNQLLDDEEAAIEASGLQGVSLFLRAEFMSQTYTSKIYDRKMKRANSYIQFKPPPDTNRFGQIILFLRTNDDIHCLVKVFRRSHQNLLYHTQTKHVITNVRPFDEDSHIIIVIPITSIVDKVIKIGNYVAIRPNTYEVNL